MTQVQLLDKTELWVRGVTVADADLPALARVAAGVLGIPADKLFVTDVGLDHVCFDVLIPRLGLDDFAGKEAALLAALGAVEGVRMSAAVSVHSDGILGLIGAAPQEVAAILAEAQRMESGLKAYAAGRVAVISTGAELVEGRVHDTNFEAVAQVLGAAGYEVHHAGAVGDDLHLIAGRVGRVASEGYGLIITTGGVGAEAKDKTVEALTLLDPGIATAALAHFKVGHGRHVKDAIRIGVATVGYSTVVALPGPTHEVRLALPVLRDGLARGVGPAALVELLAAPLRAVLPRSWHGHAHHGAHAPP
jgi:molybdenum cofactor synthesis domain-containing protein